MAMTAKLWTISGLAAELNRDRRTITRALRDVPHDGKEGRYKAWHMTTVLVAMDNGTGDTLDLTAERARFAAAQADDREMKNDLARGDQITVAEFHLMVTSAFARVRAKLLALPSGLAPLIISAKTTAEVQAMIRDGVNAALNELAGTSAAGVSTEAGIEGGERGGTPHDVA